jgi:hypothetical protein
MQRHIGWFQSLTPTFQAAPTSLRSRTSSEQLHWPGLRLRFASRLEMPETGQRDPRAPVWMFSRPFCGALQPVALTSLLFGPGAGRGAL